MTRRNHKSKHHDKVGKRKIDPLTVMRPRPKINVKFDGQMLNGMGFSAPMVTIANQAAAIYYVDCSSVVGTNLTLNSYIQSASADFNTISKYYNEYIYHSLRLDWLPYVSPGIADGGSQVYIDYIDNAEEMAALDGSSATTIFNIAKSSRNMKFFNAWERFSYNVPLSRRRKTFDTNINTTYTVDIIDRSVQGCVCVGATSSSAAVSLGQWRFTYLMELRTLNLNITT